MFFRFAGFVGALTLAVPAFGRPLSEIRSSKEIRFCLSPNVDTTPPQCTTDCRYNGSDAVVRDLALEFAKTLGVKAVFRRTEWDEQFHNAQGKVVEGDSYSPQLLEAGTCDVYPSNLTRNEWRLKKLDFAILFRNKMTVLVNSKNRKTYHSLATLAGKTVGVEKESSWQRWVQEQNKTTFKDKPVVVKELRTVDALKKLNAGDELDFVIVDSDIALWSSLHEFKNTSAVFPVGEADEVGWAFRKSDVDLKVAAEDFIAKQRDDEKSVVNRIWTSAYGVTLKKFNQIMGK